MAILRGVKVICKYAEIGEHLLREYVEKHNFPAAKIGEKGCWRSSTKLIDRWNEQIVTKNDKEEKVSY